MNEQQCSSCKNWSEIEDDVDRLDGSTMDTVRNGWCKKLKKATLESEGESCEDYESR